MAELLYVGKSVTRIDAHDKVIGVAKYCSEEGLGTPGMLYGKILYSPYAHAKIISIDTSKAERVRGVKAVLTGKDAPEHRAGVSIDDRHVLCKERVRFAGDAVAVVAAETIEAAEEALELIDVKYEVLPAIFDVEEAMKPDCPVVLHPDNPNYNRPIYQYLAEDLPGPNVHTHHKIRKGNVDEGFQQADIIVENRFQNDKMAHCQLEPYNCVCYPETDGSVTMWTSSRLYHNLNPICRAFGVSPSMVRMKSAYVGGMFGMMARPEIFAYLIATKTGKPVKMVYTREDAFIDGLSRPAKVVYIKDGVKKDGTIVAREMKVIANTGAYTDLAPLSIRNGSFHAAQYRLPNYKYDAYGVYTNETCCGPLRGFGHAELLWGAEQQMDILAEKTGMDPVEFRLKNTPDEGEVNVRGEIVHSIGAKECLKKVAEWIEWDKPSQQLKEPHIKIAKGLAIGNKYTLPDSASAVNVRVRKDGRIEVHHGTDECGQGCNTVFAQMAAEEFRVPMERIKIIWGDTGLGPYDFGAASSRSTLYTGNALLKACRDAKRQMFELAAPKLGATPDKLDTKEGKIFVKDSPERALNIADLFLGAHPDARGTVHEATCLAEGGEIVGKATFWGHPSKEDPETGQGERLSMSYCYGVQAVEVAVDTETGIVKILRLASAFDVGRAIHPKGCEGQMEGGAAMGIGSGLSEGFIFSEKGELLNPNLHDYGMPSSIQVPTGDKMVSMIVEAPHREGPFGAKGMGEASMNPTAPAIANAIYNATGARVHHLPMRPERVLQAIKESQK